MAMIKKMFKMQLLPGFKEEYEKRHQLLWPEMREALKEHGAKHYVIYLDEATNALIGYLEIEEEERWQKMKDTAINRKWWDYMADIMETNPDHSPITQDLVEVFSLCEKEKR